MVFSGIIPLKSKIRINVIPSPGFKLVVLFGLRDDSWVFRSFQGFSSTFIGIQVLSSP
jgi:hypothetical protein